MMMKFTMLKASAPPPESINATGPPSYYDYTNNSKSLFTTPGMFTQMLSAMTVIFQHLADFPCPGLGTTSRRLKRKLFKGSDSTFSLDWLLSLKFKGRRSEPKHVFWNLYCSEMLLKKRHPSEFEWQELMISGRGAILG
jgi:hypothetical protein